MPEDKEQINNIGYVEPREIIDEMQEAYLDYAMSVIISRALPDVRDGLKPVHRRILYSMWDSGLKAGAKFRKSAAVIGDVLAKYHPHGDMAVYDSLVRMAQDFSLRYPLIDGQGNFGCFTKDTKVKLTDNRNLTFEELINEANQGKKNYTYTINKIGLISIAEIKNPRLTRKGAEIIKIALDNGEEIKCTPNHLFMLKDGQYKEAQSLQQNDSLMPIYQKISEKEDRLNREGYILIYQPKNGTWVPAHHLADNYNLNFKAYFKNSGRVRHHIDFNKLNNNPDNIIRMHWQNHWQVHYQHASNQHKNPEYRKKIADGRNKYWSNPLIREKYAKLLSEKNRQNWSNPEYRENMRQFLSKVNKQYIQNHPEKRAELSRQATLTLKNLWQDPIYRASMRNKIIKGNKNHITNKTGKLKFLTICKEVLKQHFALDEQNYNLLRNKIYSYGCAPLWQTGLGKYFQNDINLIRQEVNQNHRIIKIKKINQKEDVYDLTIDNTHNFCLAAGVFVHNSMDGDGAAAYRYTESRLTRMAEEMLFDIDKETVNWTPNYDGTREEPKVLPAKLPNLLLNGSMGIAVGMMTNIPPHNLSELVDGIIHLIDEPEATIEDLSKFIKGPDFPTGGVVYDRQAIIQAYSTGKGPMVTRATTEIQETKKGAFNIIVTEVPYQVNKATLLEKIAELVKDKKLEGIKDIRDESSKEGVRVMIELKNDAYPQKILNRLFKLTDLQKTFHLNMLALVDGLQPQVLSLKNVLEYYIAHRKEVIIRRSQFDLNRAKERAHILEGLKEALDHIDAIITLIRRSPTKEKAHENLKDKFKFSDIQATAILEMRLQALAGLEREKIEAELKEKQKLIAELEALLKSPKKILGVIKDDLLYLKNTYGGGRRTKVHISPVGQFKEEDLIPEEECVITLTHGGYIKRLNPDIYKAQKRGGKGIMGIVMREEDQVEHFICASSHSNLLFFTNLGRVFQSKAYEIPEASRTARGQAIVNFLQTGQEEKITAVVPVAINKGGYLVMATKYGIIKKTPIEDFGNVRRSGLIAINLDKGDELKWARLSSGNDEFMSVTAKGQSIRFKEKDVRPMGRGAAGVHAVRLGKGDEVKGTVIISKEKAQGQSEILVIMENGYGKKSDLKYFKIQKRGGSGIKAAQVTPKTGQVIGFEILENDAEELIIISTQGQVIRISLKNIPSLGRATQGVKVMRLDTGDKVASMTIL